MQTFPKKTIVLVDDDEDLLEGMRLAFEDEGWESNTHNGKDDVLPYLLEHETDIVVLDVFLPGNHGGRVAAALRAARPEQKIILISAVGQLNRLGAQAQVDGYLSKPFQFDHLVELAERLRTTKRTPPGNSGVDKASRMFPRGPLAYSQSLALTE